MVIFDDLSLIQHAMHYTVAFIIQIIFVVVSKFKKRAIFFLCYA